MRTNEIVVARYKEDISWCKSCEDLGWKVSVYDKDESKNLLPNIGREAHSYLTHIVQRYDNLSDFTVFLQGNPHDHCSDLTTRLKNLLGIDCMFASFSNNIITCDLNGRPGCGGEGRIHMPVGTHYEWITGRKSPQVFVSPAAAQFGVSRERILSNSKEAYERALTSVSYSNNPLEAHCLERSWASIFGLISKNSFRTLNYTCDHELDLENYLKEFYSPISDTLIATSKNLGSYFPQENIGQCMTI